MPFVYRDAQTLKGKPLAGNGDCIALIKMYVPGLQDKPTASWRDGEHVMDRPHAILPGTAIATFESGRYKNRPIGNHAAIVLRVDASGIWVVDQWKQDPVSRPEIRSRFIRVHAPRKITYLEGTYKDASNNAMAFYVIEQ